MQDFVAQPHWQDILERLASIREQDDYSAANIEFIQEQLLSPDDRIRAGAALTAKVCVFYPKTIDLLVDVVENDANEAIRKASLNSLGVIIHEGVMRNYENSSGSDTKMEFYEEWDELQEEFLHEDYLRVKNLFFTLIQDDLESQTIKETGLGALSDLGFLPEVREFIQEFIDQESESAKIAALQAMGKYPQYWIPELLYYISNEQPTPLLLEAISSSYSSASIEIAQKIEGLLENEDPEILAYILLTLANINQTENLGEILQEFSRHHNEKVNQAAHEALRLYTQKNFDDYMKNELGYEES